eukprot:9167966-Pyramimonas_sp.AAC.1
MEPRAELDGARVHLAPEDVADREHGGGGSGGKTAHALPHKPAGAPAFPRYYTRESLSLAIVRQILYPPLRTAQPDSLQSVVGAEALFGVFA